MFDREKVFASFHDGYLLSKKEVFEMKLSIITICYNSGSTIERTLQSVISQKTDKIEYIIIDGKSTDDTMGIIEKYANSIDIIISEKDKGISDAFNKGISLASGEYIGIINSDDQFLPNAFELFFDEIDSDTDVFYGNGIRMYQDGSCEKYISDADPDSLHCCMSIVHPSTFVKKSAYEKYGVFDIEYKCVMDRKCLLNMLNRGAKFQYSNNYFSIYYMGGMSDKYYLRGVIPESYRIDLEDGKPLYKANYYRVSRYITFVYIKFKSIFHFRRKKISIDEMKTILEIK